MARDTLLIVEDSQVQTKIIRNRFEALTDFKLVTAGTMAETEAICREPDRDVFAAVVDLNLPDAPDGEAVDVCLSGNIPCVVLAASFSEDLRRSFLEKQVADYFLKGTIEDLDPLVACLCRLHANQKVTALAVDDSSTHRAMVRRMLGVQCIQSYGAADGVEALEVLASHPEISLIITDFEMPRMNGIELLQEVRERHRLNDMAVIGLSSAGSGTLTARFLKYGANDFLTKPFEAEEFYWRVNQTLNIFDAMQELRSLRQL